MALLRGIGELLLRGERRRGSAVVPGRFGGLNAVSPSRQRDVAERHQGACVPTSGIIGLLAKDFPAR